LIIEVEEEVDDCPQYTIEEQGTSACVGQNNGTFFIEASCDDCDPANFLYSLDGGATFQVENLFENLPSGNYNVVIRNTAFPDCDLSGTIFLAEEDNQSPTIETAVAAINDTLNVCGEYVLDFDDLGLEVTDNCDSNVVVTYSDTTFMSGTSTLTITATDATGNFSTAQVEINLVDNPATLIVTAEDDTFEGTSGEAVTFSAADLLENDMVSDGSGLEVQDITLLDETQGTLTDNGDGTFTFTPADGFTGSAALTYVVKSEDESLFFSETGNFYEFITEPNITWENALTAATERTLNGVSGYLATITSEAENDFIVERLEGNGWIGASDAEEEGVWRWVTGPEEGQQFWQGLFAVAGGMSVDGAYSRWDESGDFLEPNNLTFSDPEGEDYAHLAGEEPNGAEATKGTWNDFPNSSSNIRGYVVEYGGVDGCVPEFAATGNITITYPENVDPCDDDTEAPELILFDADDNTSVLERDTSFTICDLNNSGVAWSGRDACGEATTSTDINSTDLEDGRREVVYTITVTDEAGNTTTRNITFIVGSSPDIILFDADDNTSVLERDTSFTICDLNNSGVAWNGSDACGEATTSTDINSTDLEDGRREVVYTITATNEAGNTTTRNITFIVGDVEAPVADCPTAPFITTTDPVNGEIIAVDDILAQIEVADNCSTTEELVLSASYDQPLADEGFVNVERGDTIFLSGLDETTLTIAFGDASFNFSENCEITIRSSTAGVDECDNDTEAPVISYKRTREFEDGTIVRVDTVELTEDFEPSELGCAFFDFSDETYDDFAPYDELFVADNCDTNPTLDISVDTTTNANGDFVYTRTITASDVSGNTNSKTVTYITPAEELDCPDFTLNFFLTDGEEVYIPTAEDFFISEYCFPDITFTPAEVTALGESEIQIAATNRNGVFFECTVTIDLASNIQESVETRSADTAIEARIAPNPFYNQAQLQVNLPQASPVDIQVRDISGRVVQSLRFADAVAGQNNFTIERNALSKGVYFITVRSADALQTIRVVIAE
jgi:hypothetical protein